MLASNIIMKLNYVITEKYKISGNLIEDVNWDDARW